MPTPRDLSIYGIDTALGLRQLDADLSLYYRFLSAFAGDDSADRLRGAIACGDAKAAFERAHELKGLTAQLGLVRLSARADALCDALRDFRADSALSQARSLLPGLLRAHRQALRAIALLDAIDA